MPGGLSAQEKYALGEGGEFRFAKLEASSRTLRRKAFPA